MPEILKRRIFPPKIESLLQLPSLDYNLLIWRSGIAVKIRNYPVTVIAEN